MRILFHALMAAFLVSAFAVSAQAVELQTPEEPAAPVEIPAEQPTAPVQETATPADPSLAGSVQVTQQQPAVLNAADYLAIEVQPGDAKHDFKHYTLNVNNKQPKHVEVLQLEVVNGVTEEAYYAIQQQKSQAKRRVAGGLLRGVTGIASGFIPYAGLGSMVAYHAVHAGTTAAYGAANLIENTAGASAGNYAGRIVQRASNIILTPNQQFQCLAVVPENQPPQVKVIFKDLQTNQIFDLQK